MKFGVQFFPDVKPEQKSAAQYFDEALALAEEGDRLGFSHIRIVEHYFHYYGGYSPNPIVFLAAAAQRTRHARLVTGAVLPVFNHPLKLAGEIGTGFVSVRPSTIHTSLGQSAPSVRTHSSLTMNRLRSKNGTTVKP